MGITEEQIEKIERFCVEFYKKLDFAHNVEHMNRTLKIAEFIAKKENADREIVRLGAMVHQFHNNLDELQDFLSDLEPETAKILIKCAEFRPFKDTVDKDVSIEAKVVSDADALQVLGPQGLIREIACNIKARDKSLDKSVQDAREIESQFYKALQTETAKKIIREPHELMEKFWKSYDDWDKIFSPL